MSPAGLPIHLIQRGNNRQACLAHWRTTKPTLIGSRNIHAWVLMINHIHLLCTPLEDRAVSKMVQSINRRYVQYFNHQYKPSEILWERRYKSCLIEAENYLIEVYRYIELNPVRAKMVKDPSEYLWLSYQINALGKLSELCTPHAEYLKLG